MKIGVLIVQLLLINFFTFSCGSYTDVKVDLNQTQIDAIKNKLAAKCLTDKATLFSDLKTATTNSFDSGKIIATGNKYKITQTDVSEQTLVVLKIDTANIYVYVTGSLTPRVYKYSIANNQSHVDAIKILACGAGNTFTEDINSFSYDILNYEPDKTDDDRTEQKGHFDIKSDRPVFFSLFSRTYLRTVYLNGKVVEDEKQDIKVSYEKTENVSIDDYEDRFNLATHCTFINANWLDLDANSYLADITKVTCSANAFNWTSDIKN